MQHSTSLYSGLWGTILLHCECSTTRCNWDEREWCVWNAVTSM